MLQYGNRNYQYWLENPIMIDLPRSEINKNIITDSPGYILRDYRFYPKLKPVDMSKHNIRAPSDIEMFYAWELYNEQSAIKENKKLQKQRKDKVKKIHERRLKKLYEDRPHYLYDEVVREDYLSLLERGLNIEADDPLRDYLIKFDNIIRHLNLIISDYKISIYKDLIRGSLILIYYIFNIRFHLHTMDGLIEMNEIDLSQYKWSKSFANSLMNELKILNKIITNHLV